MIKTGPFAHLRRLDAEQRRLLLRAAGLLGVASLALAMLPFRAAIRFGSAPIGRRSSDCDHIVWAVETAARRLPWRTVCIHKSLVVQRMLRSAGIDAALHYGARHHPETGTLEAHVWVTVGGRAAIGGENAGSFAQVAVYQ